MGINLIQPVPVAKAILRQLSFSAVMKSASTGAIIADGTYSITFSIYTSDTGGTALWSETQSVVVADGVVSVNLGSSTALPSTLTFNDNTHYLGIKIGSDSEMTPRKKIGTVPTAINADLFDGYNTTTSGAASSIPVTDSSGGLTLQGGLTVGSSIVPSVSGLNLGSSTNKFAALYVDTLNVDTVTISGTPSDAFSINTDQTTNNTENSSTRFYLGPTLNTYAALQWTGSSNRFDLLSRVNTSTVASLNMGALLATTGNFSSTLGVSGAATLSSTLTVGSGDLFQVNSSGVVTAGTWNGTALTDTYVADTLTIGASSAVTWSALTSYPSACAAGSAVSTLNDTLTCTSFNTDTSITLQDAYDATSGGAIITTNNKDIDITLANTTTDSNLDIQIATDSTSYVSISRVAGVGTSNPAQFLLLDDLDADLTIADGLKIQTAGVLTDAIDVSDAEITNGINIGANTLLGTTGAIDYTNFDVSTAGAVTGASFNGLAVTTTTGTLTVTNGKTLSASNTLTLAGTDSTTITFQGTDTYVGRTTTDTLTNKTLTAPKFADLGYLADASGNELLIFDSNASAVNEITVTNAAASSGVTIAATGGDTNIALSVDAKGSGALNLNNTATGDILLGGGSGSTGCTITNSTGALACASTLNGLTVLSGTISSGTWNGTAIGATYGGTGQTTVTTGDLLYGSATNTWSKLADVATGSVLISGGVGAAPSWSASPTVTTLTTATLTSASGLALTSASNGNISLTPNSVGKVTTKSGGNDLTTSLNGYWKLEESSGNRADSAGSNTLTDTNTVTSNPGKIGTAGQFTSVNTEYLTITDNAALSMGGSQDFSISAWVYPDTLPAAAGIVAKDDGTNREYALYSDNLGKITFQLYNAGGNDVKTTTGTISTGTWSHIVATYSDSGNLISIYINGAAAETATANNGARDSTAAFTIGIFSGTSWPFNGRIDEAGVWKKTLTSTEVASLYNSGNGTAYQGNNFYNILQDWQDSSSNIQSVMKSNGSLGLGSSAPNGKLDVIGAVTASANFGLANIGATAALFDGSTAGFFAGSASGTELAVNAVSGFGGNLTDMQVAGSSKFKVTAAGVLTAASTINGLTVSSGTISSGTWNGTAIGAGYLASDSVLEASLKAVNAAVDEQCLTYELTVGDFEWQLCGDITAVGSMLTGDAFADATADDDWLGLGSAAGRIEFDDLPTDEVNILSANVGIGDPTPDGLLDLDTSATTGTIVGVTSTGIQTSGDIINVVANSLTTADIIDISATGMTTGAFIRLTGSTSTGLTSDAVNITSDVGSAGKLIDIVPDFSGAGVTGYSIYNAGTDATANANTDYGYYGSLALTGNAAKNGYGIYQAVTSSSTTGDTLAGIDIATTVTGIIGGATTRNVYGSRLQPTAGAQSTAGTTNVYGQYIKASGDVGAGGTVNVYGLYIANGTQDTDGTSTVYGLYVENPTGADVNHTAYINGPISTKRSTITVTTTLNDTHSVVIAENTAAITINLPTAVGRDGRQITIKKATNIANDCAITIDPAGTETIDNATTDATVDIRGESMTIVSDNVKWHIISNYQISAMPAC